MSVEPMVVDIKAAAKLLGLSTRTMSKRVRDGTIPSKRIGKLIRFSPDELRAWLADCPSAAREEVAK